MKRGMRLNGFIVIILAVSLFSITIASAAVCSDPNQRILKLHDNTNTHGEFWDGTSYTVEICYDDVFGSAFDTGGGNPHLCTGTNNVTRLSGLTNAHAEGPNANTPGYMPVCYGDLSCALIPEASCLSPSEIVVKLSSNGNAHLGDASSAYTNVICCGTGGASPPVGTPEAYWTDVSAAKLGNNFMINTEGGVVKLLAKSLTPGETITFEIWDNDSVAGESGGDDFIKNVTAVADSTGLALTSGVNFNLLDYARGDDMSEDNGILELYFIARNTTTGTNIPSENQILLNHTESSNVIVIEKEGCAFFTEQNSCDTASEPYWRKSELDYQTNNGPVGGVGCQQTNATTGTFYNCSCQWTTRNQCEFNWQGVPSPANWPPGVIGANCIGSCNVQSDYGQCVDDSLTITYLANFEVAASCTGTSYSNPGEEIDCNLMNGLTDEIMCGLSPSLVLPFFSLTQFFISAISIFAIYLFLIWKKRS